MRAKRYWGYRIDTSAIDFFRKELDQGRLRQGWGYDEGQDLRKMTVDKGASRNYRMKNEVKKGDILLVPRIPTWDLVSVVEATEDWDSGYQFKISELEDYGHIFPARLLKTFSRSNEVVSGGIRSSLKNPCRFWNMDYYGEDIEAILKADSDRLNAPKDNVERFKDIIEGVFHDKFKEKEFTSEVYKNVCKGLQASEWEDALVEGLSLIYPEPLFHIERTGGRSEEKHGTDIAIYFHSTLSDEEYVIAIQVKDYTDVVSVDVLAQINKANEYFKSQGKKVIEKILIITSAKKEENQELIKYCGDVKILFADGVESLLGGIGLKYISPLFRD